jgi:mono/diheme cytochrome c family protein
MAKTSVSRPRRRWRLVLILIPGVIATALLLAATTTYAVSEYRLRRTHAVEIAAPSIPSSPEVLARGRHLVITRGCADCHGDDFGGRAVVEDPLVGRLHGPNLTSGRGGLPATFGDVDFVRAVRHGLAPDGRALVLMPSIEYANLSDEDLGAMIAYLKSLPAVDRERGPVQLGPLSRGLLLAGEIKLAAEHIDHRAVRPVRVEVEVSREYGHYLAASCAGCHGDNLSGGRIPGGPPDWPAAANLTPHPSGRLVQWSEGDFFTALRQARRPDGSSVHPVMPAAFGQLTDEETKALWIYLRSLPPAPTGVRTTH